MTCRGRTRTTTTSSGRSTAVTFGTSESALKDAFSSYLPLSAEIAYDRDTGRSRGFGFVQFEDQKALDGAIQGMNGQQIGGRTVTVSQANDRPRRWKA